MPDIDLHQQDEKHIELNQNIMETKTIGDLTEETTHIGQTTLQNQTMDEQVVSLDAVSQETTITDIQEQEPVTGVTTTRHRKTLKEKWNEKAEKRRIENERKAQEKIVQKEIDEKKKWEKDQAELIKKIDKTFKRWRQKMDNEYMNNDNIDSEEIEKSVEKEMFMEPITNEAFVCVNCRFSTNGGVLECHKYDMKPVNVFNGGNCPKFKAKNEK